MAARLLAYEVADLCLGKPPLRSLSVTATVGEAVAELKSTEESFLSVWSCDHSRNESSNCVCIGKVCMVDIICFLCKEENLCCPGLAFESPVSVLLSQAKGLVRHVESSLSLLEAIDLILQGAQNLVVPIRSDTKRKKLHKSSSISSTMHGVHEFCWLTQEDVIRFILSNMGLFSSIPALSIDALGVISQEFHVIEYHSPASSALNTIQQSLVDQTSVALVDEDGILIGEISPLTLTCCDETAAAAIMTLSAGDLMAYINSGVPSEELVRLVEARLKDRSLEGMLEEFMVDTSESSSSSSDEELPSPTTPRSVMYSKPTKYLARMVRGVEAIVCRSESSLVAIMVQTIAHRVNYVWVIEDDCSIAGIVTFANMLQVYQEIL